MCSVKLDIPGAIMKTYVSRNQPLGDPDSAIGRPVHKAVIKTSFKY